MRVSFFAIALAILSLQTQNAAAWNAAGHRLSALIAWQQLDEETRTQVNRLLGKHPDHARWLARSKGDDPAMTAFVEASTWPDEIKSDRRFFDSGDGTPTPVLPGYTDMARHRNWHYLDRPLGHHSAAAPPKGELETRLNALAARLGNEGLAEAERAYALPWLIHLLADAHQPLHVVSRYDANGHGDEGGNLLSIENPFHPRHSSTNLHSYWDDLPGPPWLRGERLASTAQAIMAEHPQPPAPGGTAHWIEESFRVARERAYPVSEDVVPTLTADFHARAQASTRERLAAAGWRLAALLQELLTARSQHRTDRVSRETGQAPLTDTKERSMRRSKETAPLK